MINHSTLKPQEFPMIKELATEFKGELVRRIGLDCDRTEFKDGAVYFYFDSLEKWTTIFEGRVGVREAVAAAKSMGILHYVFVQCDGREYATNWKHWIPKNRSRRGR